MTVVITSSLLFSGLYSGTDANAQVVSQAVDNAKPSQYNQIDFEPSIPILSLKDIFKKNYKNLTNISITGEYVTESGYSIPLKTEYSPADDNKNTDNLKTVQKQLAQQLKIAKENLNKPKQKFDTKELLKGVQTSSQTSSSVTTNSSATNSSSNVNTNSLNQTSQQTSQQMTQPSNAVPTADELKYYEENGYLPPIKIDEAKLKQDLKGTELEGKPIPHLDSKLKGKFSNAKLEDKLASMTPEEKQNYDQAQIDTQTQTDLLKTTTTKELDALEKSDTKSDISNIKITQVSFYTSTDYKNLEQISRDNKKPHKANGKTDTNQPKIAKAKKLTDTEKNNRKTNSFKLQSVVKPENSIAETFTQDLSGMFKVSDADQKAVKDKQNTDKTKALEHNKKYKQQYNKMEAESYKKEGVTVPYIDEKGKEKSIADTGNILTKLLGLEPLSASAKGLNNSLNSLIMYIPSNNSLSVTFPTQNNGQQGNMDWNGGYYGKQRFCFDNETNLIKLTNNQYCNQQTTNLCLDDFGGRFNYGDKLALWPCHGGDSQKWFFDEDGRLSLVSRPDLCVDGFGGVNSGSNLGLWGCHSGSNQQVRAGYNNFGTGMGMTMWAINSSSNILCDNSKRQCSNGYNGPGHAFVEFWNNYGSHNTFSRWNFTDSNTWSDGNFPGKNGCSNDNGASVNNICDNDALTVDVEIDLKTNRSKYNGFKNSGIYATKEYWDSMVFGSGYRNNYRNGVKIDLGSNGTYDWNGNSRTRDTRYKANYGILYGVNFINTEYVCSGQAIKLWNSPVGYQRYDTGWYNNKPAMSPDSLYAQM